MQSAALHWYTLDEIRKEIASIAHLRRWQIVSLLLMLLVFLVVLDVVIVLKVFDVPELDVIVVRTRRHELSRIAYIHRLDAQRMLSNDAQIAARHHVHRPQDTLFATRDSDALRHWNHQTERTLWTREHVAVHAELVPVVMIETSLGRTDYQFGFVAEQSHAGKLFVVRL